MIIGRKSCSCVQSVGERSSALKLGKAKARAVASRELGSASLRKTESGQPAEYGEASTALEASTKRTERTLRGGRRQRVPRERLGTWETLLTRSQRAGSSPNREEITGLSGQQGIGKAHSSEEFG